ncbi:MAG: class I SAM-dependent methyltransferase [Hymenobacteraceae bacterium]|nr:class I SAM-dependent methyltransferase [Hymenobacteraceae bacterium]
MSSADDVFRFVRCLDCGLVYLNPVVPTQLIAAYYSEHYLPYHGAGVWGKYSRFVTRAQKELDRKRVNQVRKLAKLGPQSRVLDVGCGRPSFLACLQQQTGCEAWGLDFKATGWEHQKKYRHVKLLEGEVKDLPAQLPFDLITMWHYLEHDYHPVATLRRLQQASHPHTLLFVEVPDEAGATRKLQGRHWAGYHTPRHISLFSRKTLRQVAAQSGWQECAYFPNGTLSPYILWWLGHMEKKGIDWSGSLEPQVLSFLAGYALSAPLIWLARPFLPMGVQLAVFKKGQAS